MNNVSFTIQGILILSGELLTLAIAARLIFGKWQELYKIITALAVIQLFHSSIAPAMYHGITIAEYELYRLSIILFWLFLAFIDYRVRHYVKKAAPLAHIKIEDIIQLGITINGVDALNRIKPYMMKAYLSKLGFAEALVRSDGAVGKWEKGDQSFMVLYDESLADYAGRMRELLNKVVEFQNSNHLYVYSEILKLEEAVQKKEVNGESLLKAAIADINQEKVDGKR